MSCNRKNVWIAWILFIGLLLLPSLACEKAGQILTPAEATARAREAAAPTATSETPPTPVAEGGIQVGDVVYLTGKGYLISIVAEPGAMRMIAGQERGVEVTIIDVADVEGETWYRIDAPTGEGWVPAENITTEKP